MHDLFPSSSAPKRPRLSSAFDPTQPCVALQQQQKKKAARCKPSKVTVMYLHDTQICPPKGKHKKELQSTGRHKKLEFTRYMSSVQVKSVIKRGFKEVSLESFTYLVVDGSTLTLDPVQDQDGDMLITSAAAKKGILYISGPSHVS